MERSGFLWPVGTVYSTGKRGMFCIYLCRNYNSRCLVVFKLNYCMSSTTLLTSLTYFNLVFKSWFKWLLMFNLCRPLTIVKFYVVNLSLNGEVQNKTDWQRVDDLIQKFYFYRALCNWCHRFLFYCTVALKLSGTVGKIVLS